MYLLSVQVHTNVFVICTRLPQCICYLYKFTPVYLFSVQVHTSVFVICTSLPQCICFLYKFTPVYLLSVHVHTSVFIICTSSHQCICFLCKFTPVYLLSVQVHPSVFVICASSHQCICNLCKFMFAVLLSLVAVYHYYAMLIHVSLTKIYILMLILHNYPQRMFGIRLTSLILPYFVPVPNQRTWMFHFIMRGLFLCSMVEVRGYCSFC